METWLDILGPIGIKLPAPYPTVPSLTPLRLIV